MLSRVREILSKIGALLHRSARDDRALADEMAHHLALLEERYAARGLTRAAARREARRAFGGLQQLTEDHRDRRSFALITQIRRDATYALRLLRRSPGFSIVAVLTLALGIGANTAIFSVVNAAFFARYPIAAPERLVRLYGEDLPRNARQLGFSLPKFDFFRRHQTSFSELGAVTYNGFSWARGAEAEQIAVAAITSNFLTAFGVRPLAGRFFHVHEETGVRLAVLGEEFWRERFAGDPNAVGQTLLLSGHLYTIVGVAPRLPAFWDAQVWLTEPFEIPGLSRDLVQRGVTFLAVVGRIRPGVSHDQATREVELLGTRYRDAHASNADSGWTATTVSLRDDIVGTSRSSIAVLLAGVGLLLVVACANVANLLLVRFTGRRQEMAMRAALGASPARLVRQLVIESVMLSTIAAGLGMAFAWTTMPVLLDLAANNLAFVEDITVNLPVLAATVALSIIAGVFAGAYPALQGSRFDVVSALRDGARTVSGSLGARAAGHAFVGAQVALSLVLLIGALLLVTSFHRLRQQDPGFDPGRIFAAAVNLPVARYPDPNTQQRFYERLAAALNATPGVERATLAQTVPLNGPFTRAPYAVDEGAVAPLNERPLGLTESLLPGYFATLGIPVRAGRDFTEHDTASSPRVAIVSESTARRLFGDRDPIGRYIFMGPNGPGQRMEIVGVVGDIRSQTLRQVAEVEFYRPVAQRPRTFMQLVVRTAGDPGAFESTARRLVADLDPALPLVGSNTLTAIMDRSLAQERLLFTLLGVFAVLAVTLSAVGIYAVVSDVVAARTAEIGVRMALGARAGQVLGLVLGTTMRPIAVGLGVGLVAAAALGRFVQALLFDVSPLDPIMLTAAASALALVACVACVLPASRAARLSPLRAIRQR